MLYVVGAGYNIPLISNVKLLHMLVKFILPYTIALTTLLHHT